MKNKKGDKKTRCLEFIYRPKWSKYGSNYEGYFWDTLTYHAFNILEEDSNTFKKLKKRFRRRYGSKSNNSAYNA